MVNKKVENKKKKKFTFRNEFVIKILVCLFIYSFMLSLLYRFDSL